MTEKDHGEAGRANRFSKTQKYAIFGPVLAAFAIVTSAAVMAAYRFGEGVIHLQGRTISELTFFEVTGGAAMGILGAVAGLGIAAVGAVGTLAAAMIGASIGIFGLILGSVVAIGVVTGPILLVTVVAILIKRKFWPDVI